MVKRIGLLLLILLVLAIAGFVGWAEFPSSPMPEALAALQSNNKVTIEEQRWIEFVPTTTQPTTGFIFYPGGRVDARAYAPTMRQIAEAGYYAVIVPMPLNLAFFGANRADAVIAAYPEIQHWVIGGHSLGGVFAAGYAFDHPSQIDGLALWASYPQASQSLAAQQQLEVVSLRGSNDGLTTDANIQQSKSHLPATAQILTIQGGNHAYFGWYGEQSGDNPATISREDQQTQTVAAMLTLLQNVMQK